MRLIFASVVVPLIAKLNVALGAEIARSSWNDSLPPFRRPLSFFISRMLFLSVGLGMVMGTAIKFQTLDSIGISAFFFGAGILVGIWLTLKWTKTK